MAVLLLVVLPACSKSEEERLSEVEKVSLASDNLCPGVGYCLPAIEVSHTSTGPCFVWTQVIKGECTKFDLVLSGPNVLPTKTQTIDLSRTGNSYTHPLTVSEYVVFYTVKCQGCTQKGCSENRIFVRNASSPNGTVQGGACTKVYNSYWVSNDAENEGFYLQGTENVTLLCVNSYKIFRPDGLTAIQGGPIRTGRIQSEPLNGSVLPGGRYVIRFYASGCKESATKHFLEGNFMGRMMEIPSLRQVNYH